jgi:hypothetical protein
LLERSYQAKLRSNDFLTSNLLKANCESRHKKDYISCSKEQDFLFERSYQAKPGSNDFLTSNLLKANCESRHKKDYISCSKEQDFLLERSSLLLKNIELIVLFAIIR